MGQSLSVGTITFSEVPGGAEVDSYICTTSHSRPCSVSEATVMGRVSGSVCCPSWWTCISTVTLPSDSSVTHGTPAMASKSSLRCACILCIFMVLLVLLGELCRHLILTRLRWFFLPSTGVSASTQISSWVSKLTQPLQLRLPRPPPRALMAPRLLVLVDPRIGGATSVMGGSIMSYFSGEDSSSIPRVLTGSGVMNRASSFSGLLMDLAGKDTSAGTSSMIHCSS